MPKPQNKQHEAKTLNHTTHPPQTLPNTQNNYIDNNNDNDNGHGNDNDMKNMMSQKQQGTLQT